MTSIMIDNLPYSLLEGTQKIPWTSAQEASLSKEFPFPAEELSKETPEEYVARTYLQFLWLPTVGFYTPSVSFLHFDVSYSR